MSFIQPFNERDSIHQVSADTAAARDAAVLAFIDSLPPGSAILVDMTKFEGSLVGGGSKHIGTITYRLKKARE